MHDIHGPHLGLVATGFFDRRDRLNMTQDELAEEAGVNRDTVSAIENGRGGAVSRRKVDEALARLERDAGFDATTQVEPVPQAGAAHLMEFEVTGDFGVRVVVKGPVENAAELEASVARLIRDMKRDRPTRRGETA